VNETSVVADVHVADVALLVLGDEDAVCRRGSSFPKELGSLVRLAISDLPNQGNPLI
jgi:hypothetical protein